MDEWHDAGLTCVCANRTWTTLPARCVEVPSSPPGPHPPWQSARQRQQRQQRQRQGGSYSAWECPGCPAQLAHHPEISCLNRRPGHSPHLERPRFLKGCPGSANPMMVLGWTKFLPSTGGAGERQRAAAATSHPPPCTGFKRGQPFRLLSDPRSKKGVEGRGLFDIFRRTVRHGPFLEPFL